MVTVKAARRISMMVKIFLNFEFIFYFLLKEPLEICNIAPITGFTRTGKCETNQWDHGTHLICARVNKKFLEYTKSKGNDLSTPRSWFPGLKDGDNWCLCVFRWVQAYRNGFAPAVILNATNKEAIKYLKRLNVNLKDLSNI